MLYLSLFRQFQDFFFSHFNLISSSLEQLRERIEEALWSRRQVLNEIVMKAYENFVESFKSLYCAQRIKVRTTVCTCVIIVVIVFVCLFLVEWNCE